MSDEHSLDDPLLGDLFAEMRSWGEAPAPAPSEALASLLAADPTPIAGEPALAPLPRRKKMLVSKLAALGVVAKAALGVGVAAAAVTTAGATGVLPDAAQHAVATAVDVATPFQLPDPLGGAITPTLKGGGGGNKSADVSDDADDDADDEAGGTGQPANHGACVSAIAKDKTVTGREHGQAVSAVAKSDCGKASTTSTTLGSTTSSSSTSSTSSTSTSTSTTVATGNANRGASGNSGPGNSGNAGGNSGSGNSGNGNGNAGNGNSGNGGGNSGRS